LRMVELSLNADTPSSETKKFSKKADDIAEKIGNEELAFMASVKRAQVELWHGDKELAVLSLKHLLKTATTDADKAEILYILGTSKVVGNKEDYKQEGFSLFQELYKQTPKFDYKMKMDALAS